MQNGAKFIQKLTPGLKYQTKNLDNFKKPGESPKNWNSMDCIFLKKYIASTKTLYTEDLSNITFNYLCENSPNPLCPFWNHHSFFTTPVVYIILAQTLHTFDKHIPLKYKFLDFSLLKFKLIKFLMSLFKQRVIFSLNFGSLFSVMRNDFWVLI